MIWIYCIVYLIGILVSIPLLSYIEAMEKGKFHVTWGDMIGKIYLSMFWPLVWTAVLIMILWIYIDIQDIPNKVVFSFGKSKNTTKEHEDGKLD